MAFSPTSSRFWETSLSRLPPSEDLFANLQEDIDLKDYEATLTCSCTIANNREYQQIPSMVKKSNKLDTCLELTYIEGRHVCHSHRLYWHFQSDVAVSQTFLKVFRQKHRKDQHEDHWEDVLPSWIHWFSKSSFDSHRIIAWMTHRSI